MKKYQSLAKKIVPETYWITLSPDLLHFTFTGTLKCRFKLTTSSREITFHAKELIVKTGSSILTSKKHTFTPSNNQYDEQAETVTWRFSELLPTGVYEITCEYSGILNDKMDGFYRSSFSHKGKTKYLATTQFEATAARMAFPCIDEPNAKAVFHLSVVTHNNHKVISNTEVVFSEKVSATHTKHVFNPSPVMSTYLVGVVCGELETVKKTTEKGVTIAIHTTPDKKHQTAFALEATDKLLHFFEEYFDIPFPLKTLDLVAIPDFASGAMENWGVITFREQGLLVDPTESSSQSKQYVTEIIAHELAHQWFGNLVTMNWWTHLWLNEGFASYMGDLATEKTFPEFQTLSSFVASDMELAFDLDSQSTSHAIEVNVNHPDEIREIFDHISYLKGEALIRMLDRYLGPETFRKGIVSYLKQHAYQNTETKDLWQALEKASGQPVKQIMSKFTGIQGYPLVSVTKRNGELRLSQNPFGFKQTNVLWPVPITGRSDTSTIPKTVLKKQHGGIRIPKKALWVKINDDASGFYRVRYSASLLEKLLQPFHALELSEHDRISIVSDLAACSYERLEKTSKVLRIIFDHTSETSVYVWSQKLNALLKIHNLVSETSPALLPQLDTQIIKLCLPELSRVGIVPKKGDSHQTTTLRSLLLNVLVSTNHRDSIKTLYKLYLDSRKTNKPVHPDLRTAVYHAVGKTGKLSDYTQMKQAFLDSTMTEEQRRLFRGLTKFEALKFVQSTIKLLDSPAVRSQDLPIYLRILGHELQARTSVWKYLQANLPILQSKFEGLGVGSHFVEWLGSSYSEELYQDAKAYFKHHTPGFLKRVVAQTLERFERNIKWKKFTQNDLETYLKKEYNK